MRCAKRERGDLEPFDVERRADEFRPAGIPALLAGAEFKVLATNKLDDSNTLSSLAVSGSQLFMRTSTHLYCIGKTGQ